jgi:hypothetical protein
MALQLRRGETRSFSSMVAASFVVMALLVQALIMLSAHQLAFADNTSLSAPTTPYPADNGAINTNDFWFTWSTVPGAASYEWQGSTSNAKNGDGSLANVMWTGDYQRVQPISPTAHSVGASGTWYWQVRAVASDGSKGLWSSVWKMTIDWNLPDAPSSLAWKTSSNQSIASGGVTNLYAGTASWQDATPSKVNHYVYKYWNDIAGNPYKIGSEYVTTTTSMSLAGVFNQGEGVHHFCVAAVDTAGNASTCTPFTISYDLTAPVATFAFSNNNGATLTRDDVTVTMTTNEPAQTPSGWTRIDDTHFTRAYADNGKYKVVVTDLAGNASAKQSFTVKRIDRNAPTISGVTDGSIVAGAVNLSIFDPKYEGYDGFDKAHGVTVDGVAVKMVSGPDKTYLYTVSGEGHHVVVATDKAGNSIMISFTIDTTAPTVADLSVDHNPTNLGQLTVNGTVTDDNLKDYNLRVYNADKATLVTPWIGLTGMGNVSDGTLGTLNIAALADGNYWVRIWADDLAGNRTGISSQIFIPFTIDRTAPNVSITGFTRNSDGTYTVAGSTDDSSDVVVAVDSQTPLVVTPNSGAWSVKTAILVDGTHTVSATSIDAVGNESTPSEKSYTTSSGNTTVEKFAGIIAAALPVRFSATVPFTTGAPINAANNDQSVLGDQTTTPSDGETSSSYTKNNEAVKGASTTRNQGSAPSFIGLAWYWWLAALAMVASLWWLFGTRRRKTAE